MNAGKCAAAAALVALALAASSCGRSPSDAQLRSYAEAAARFEEGDFAAAKRALGGAGELPPARILSGKIDWYGGDAASAERAFRAAAKAAPASVEARVWLARSLRSLGKEEEAAKLVESVLSDDPGEVRSLRMAAEAASERGDAASAAAYLDRALGSAGELAFAYIDRARLRWIAGDGEAALDDLGKATALLPADSAAARAARKLTAAIKEGTK